MILKTNYISAHNIFKNNSHHCKFSSSNSEVSKSDVNSLNLNHIPHYKASFKGELSKNLKVGDQVLREFLNEYGMIHSWTAMERKYNEYKKAGASSETLNKIRTVDLKFHRDVWETRNIVGSTIYPNANELSLNVIKAVKKHKGANCSEIAIIINHMLSERGIPAKRMWTTLKNADGSHVDRQEHELVVIGLPEGFNIPGFAKAKVMGKNAVVIDGWLKKVMTAAEASKCYGELLECEPEKHYVAFVECHNQSFW